MTLPSRGRNSPSQRAADLASVPPDAWFTTWVAGVLFPLVVFGFGVSWVITQHATLLSLRYLKYGGAQETPWLDFDGRECVLLGLAAVFAALAMHFNWFWRAHPKLVQLHDPLRYLAASLTFVMLIAFGISLMTW